MSGREDVRGRAASGGDQMGNHVVEGISVGDDVGSGLFGRADNRTSSEGSGVVHVEKKGEKKEVNSRWRKKEKMEEIKKMRKKGRKWRRKGRSI